MKNEKNNMAEGTLSFDPEELKNATPEGHPNDDAYELLWEATCVSSHVKEVDKAAGTTSEDNVYPTSAEEVDKMEELIDKATQELQEPDAEFSQRVDELRGIIAWSRKRHWQFNWRIIAGAILTAFLLPMFLGGDANYTRQLKNNVVKVNKWEPVELLHFDNLEALLNAEVEGCDDKYKYETATNWYNSNLRSVAWNYIEAKKNLEEYEAGLKDPEKEFMHDNYKKYIPKEKERIEDLVERFDDLKDLDFEKAKKIALEEAEDRVSAAEFEDGFATFLIICFVMIIPLYIFATRPYGYMISRYRREAKYLGWLEKIGLWLSGGMLAAGASIGFVDIITKWSDGSTTREDDGTGPARIAIKVLLFAGAVLVFCCVSSFLMIYATITGLIRNYDWMEIKNKVMKAKG